MQRWRAEHTDTRKTFELLVGSRNRRARREPLRGHRASPATTGRLPDSMKPKAKEKRPLDNITFGKNNMRSKGECHRSQCEMGCNCGD